MVVQPMTVFVGVDVVLLFARQLADLDFQSLMSEAACSGCVCTQF
jgi:hypothetical protein